MTRSRFCPSLPLAVAGVCLLWVSLALAEGPLDRATAAFDTGDLRTAEVALKALLQKDPGLIEARLLLGRTYLRLNDGASAAKEFQRALELGTGEGALRLELAEAMLQQNQFSETIAWLERTAAVAEPSQAAAAFGLQGRALIGLERYPEARAAFAEAAKLDPSDRVAGFGLAQLAVLDGDAALAGKTLDQLLTIHPKDADLMLLRAEVYRQQNQTEQALTQFAALLELEPANLRALLGHATVLVGLNRFAEARADLDKIDEVKPDVVVVSYLRGVMAFYEQNWQAASSELNRVLSAQPNHLQSILLMGIVSYARNELAIAEEYLSRVLKAMPDNLQAAKVLAATQLKAREPARAVSTLEPFATGNDPQIMALLGSAYMLAGEQAKGQDWLARAVEAAPNVAALRTQLALTLIAGGQTGEAIAELESAVDLGQDVIQADVLLVLALLKEQKFAEAIAASEALEVRRPESPVAFNLTGLAYLSQNKLDEASARFEQALKLDADFTTALINLARVEVARKDLDAATARYQAVLQKEPKNLAALLGLAALAELRGDPVKLQEALHRAQDANPEATQPGILLARFHIDRRDYLKALGIASDLGARFPKDADVLEVLGRAQTLANEQASAIRTFDQAIELRANDPRLYQLKGGAQWKAEDLTGAVRSFERAIELKPDYQEARIALGSVLLAAERFDEATEVARGLQKDYPDQPLGWRMEGRVLTAARNYAGAVTALTRAQEIAPAGDTVRELAEVQVRAGNTDAALRGLQGWTQQHPDDLETLSYLALLYQGEGRDGDALPLYLRLYETGRAGPVVLNNLAWILQGQRDPRALEIAAKAYEQLPNRPEIADTYGWILYQSGRRDEGLNILQQAHLAYPTQTEIAYHVAVALDALGRGDEATKVLRRLLQDYPNAPEAAAANALLGRLAP